MAGILHLYRLTVPILFGVWLLSSHSTHAQSIAMDMPVPPLQWINLSSLLQGSSAPPPLKDAAIGYDETSRSIIIFGGESAGGFVQSQTYLLNLDTLRWSIPSPPANLLNAPAARSAATFGGDFAASNRHGFVVIGGKGSGGGSLSDIWEYDFNNQFWSEVETTSGGPLPRWGATGGIDISTSPIQDPILPGPNNTFYLVGGFDGTSTQSLSDIWRLNISGTLSSNLPNDSTGSWDHLTIGNLPPKVNSAGTVVSNQIVSIGGCNSTSINESCTQQDSYIINTQQRTQISPNACPAPRHKPVVVPNMNRFSSAFTSQVYLLLGTLDPRWQSGSNLQEGEVAVLDIHTGSWSRVIPSGDPGTSGKPAFPTPRDGAAAFSYSRSLVGQSRNASADTIIFGGQDSLGNVLSEVWLLRAYTGIVTPSQLTWSGFGNGKLQTGTEADGSGVRIEYIMQCAVLSNPTPSSPPSPATPTSNPGVVVSPSPSISFDTSALHKILAPVSLAIFQVLLLLSRFFNTSYRNHLPVRRAVYGLATAVVALAAYILGIVGLVTSFTSLSETMDNHQLPSRSHFETGHGIGSFVLFVCVCCLLGQTLFSAFYRRPWKRASIDVNGEPGHLVPSYPSEKLGFQSASPLSSPRPRTNSWGPSSILHRSQEGRLSSDSESIHSAGMQRGFEVVNRPTRARQTSESWQGVPSTSSHAQSASLGDIDWLQRRRSLNAVGELDYAITQAQAAQLSTTPAGGNATIPAASIVRSQSKVPSPCVMLQHVLVQASVLGLTIITLIALWSRAPRVAFAVFLAWSVAFYAILLAFSWKLQPDCSLLLVVCNWLRSPKVSEPSPVSTPVPQSAVGPYTIHRPPYRTAASPESISFTPRSFDTDARRDDDIDEDARQRMIEDEMGRRDVSIITIPKRKLWVANPS